MAAIAYHVMPLCRKMATDSPKIVFCFNKRYICACKKKKIILQILFQWSDNSNMAANRKDGR